uniref:Uncharacterized protein n=1 Tax=uncultured prokaryote TaxID=198431 RepID=A0A0H5Q365_9ZZZZ|nr:hypothetical protein [uncultured prokaryote]
MTRVILACMARATEWRRWYGEYVDDALAHIIKFQMPSFTSGETLTRVRYHWQAQHPSLGVAAEAPGIIIGVGIIDVPSGTAKADVPSPLSYPDVEWIAYEHTSFLPYTVISPDTYIAYELDLAPVQGGERDSRAQRVGGALGRDMWLCAEVDQDQGVFYLSCGGSSLFLLPA